MSEGYWEPHSSSVDFCERNYVWSPYVAEFHNTWSSLIIAWMGLIGMLYGNPLKEWNVTVMFFILFVIGMGSVALHSTLHWFPQSSDEVPMLWQALSLLYVLVLCQYDDSVQQGLGVAYLFILVAIIQTYIYYVHQQIYFVFLVSMILYTAAVIIWSGCLLYQNYSDHHLRIIWFSSLICFVAIGFMLWILDMNLCESLLPVYQVFGGATLHILWHIFAGLGTYLLISFFIVYRLKHLGYTVKGSWALGLPVFLIKEKAEKLS